MSGKAFHNLEVSPHPSPHVAGVSHGSEERETGRTCLILWAEPRPPLACYGLLNYVDFAGPGFSVHRGRAGPLLPATLSQGRWWLEELRLAVTVPPVGE